MARHKSSTDQMAFDLAHNPSFEEDDFIVTRANQLAFDHIISFPGWSAPLSLISGPPKSGKSHLAGIWHQRAHAIAPEAKNIETIARAGGRDPVILEDVDRAGLEEQALFHLLNQSIRDQRPVLMTARAAIYDWPFSTDDVKSRARLAAHFEVAAADDAQLAQMFVKLFDDRQVRVAPKIIAFLVARMERSPEEVVILTRLMDEVALARGKPISRAIASEALELRAKKSAGTGATGLSRA